MNQRKYIIEDNMSLSSIESLDEVPPIIMLINHFQEEIQQEMNHIKNKYQSAFHDYNLSDNYKENWKQKKTKQKPKVY